MPFTTKNIEIVPTAEAPRVALALRSFGPKGRN
jgi:hypothetical protein